MKELRKIKVNIATREMSSRVWINAFFHMWFLKVDDNGNQTPHALYENEKGIVNSIRFHDVEFVDNHNPITP